MSAQRSGTASGAPEKVLFAADREIERDRVLMEARRLRSEVTARLLMAAGRAVKSVFSALWDAWMRERDRQEFACQLRGMSDRQLADIGIERDNIEVEAARAALGLSGSAKATPQLAIVRSGLARPACDKVEEARPRAA